MGPCFSGSLARWPVVGVVVRSRLCASPYCSVPRPRLSAPPRALPALNALSNRARSAGRTACRHEGIRGRRLAKLSAAGVPSTVVRFEPWDGMDDVVAAGRRARRTAEQLDADRAVAAARRGRTFVCGGLGGRARWTADLLPRLVALSFSFVLYSRGRGHRCFCCQGKGEGQALQSECEGGRRGEEARYGGSPCRSVGRVRAAGKTGHCGWGWGDGRRVTRSSNRGTCSSRPLTVRVYHTVRRYRRLQPPRPPPPPAAPLDLREQLLRQVQAERIPWSPRRRSSRRVLTIKLILRWNASRTGTLGTGSTAKASKRRTRPCPAPRAVAANNRADHAVVPTVGALSEHSVCRHRWSRGRIERSPAVWYGWATLSLNCRLKGR